MDRILTDELGLFRGRTNFKAFVPYVGVGIWWFALWKVVTGFLQRKQE